MKKSERSERMSSRITRVALWGVGLALLLTLTAYLLPRMGRFPDSIATLDASPAELFPLFNSREGHRRAWTLASERVGAGSMPPMTHGDLGGPPGGVGTRTCFCLTGEGLGPVGRLVSPLVRGEGLIVESEPDRRVVYEIAWGFMLTRRTIDFEPVGVGATRVVWMEEAEATNPLMRFVLLGASSFPTFDGVLTAAGELARAGRGASP